MTYLFRTGFLATVESHSNVPFEILKVYTGTFQNTVDIRKLNALTHAIMQLKLLHVALRLRLIILNKAMYK